MVDIYIPWANGSVGVSDVNGPKVETDATFDETKISTGSTHERLPYPTFNRLHNRADNAIKGILQGGLRPFDGADANHYMGLYPTSVSGVTVEDSINIVSADGGSARYADSLVCYSRLGKDYLIGLNTQGRTVDVFDLSDFSKTSDDLSTDLGTPNGAWVPYSGCTDGVWLYVLWVDTGHVSALDRYRVQAYDLSDLSTQWTPGGISLDDGTNGSGKVGCIIMATPTSVGVNLAWRSTTNSTVIMVLDSADGSTLSQGKGDTSVGSGRYAQDIMVSDGTYLYLPFTASTGWAQIASYNISTGGTSGCGGTGWPTTLQTPYEITNIGGMMAAEGKILFTTGGAKPVYITTPSKFDCGSIGEDGPLYYNQKYAVGYDGCRFWGLGQFFDGGHKGITRLSGVHAAFDGTDVVLPHVMETWRTAPTTIGIGPTRLIFNGKDFYFTIGQFSSSAIYRFPKPLLK